MLEVINHQLKVTALCRTTTTTNAIVAGLYSQRHTHTKKIVLKLKTQVSRCKTWGIRWA